MNQNEPRIPNSGWGKKMCIVFKNFFILIILTLFLQNYSFAQKEVTGVITNFNTGEPLPDVSVMVKGTSSGVVSDELGNFKIMAKTSDSLVFSIIGFNSQTFFVGNLSVINVKMSVLNAELAQVVVVGYGTQQKATLTGSISDVSGAEIQKSPAPNISNSLAGRLPGLVAVTREGTPGEDESLLRIRGVNTLGDNSPLVVVDGIANRDLNRIDPAAIESITILKDASAAIYGSEAANGVILVTTKRGKTGKPMITANFNQGWNQPTVLPKMAGSPEYAEMLNEIRMYQNQEPRFSEEDIKLFRDGTDPWGHPNTDWFKETIKPWSPQTYANLTLSGGSENVRYFLTGGYTYQDGIFYNSATYYKQPNFRSNIDAKISNRIRVSFDVSARQEGRYNSGVYNINGALNVWWGLNRQYPYLPAYWPNGLPGPDVEYGSNPVVTVTNETGYLKNITYILQNVAKIEVDIPGIDGLTFTGLASYDKDFNNFKQFTKPWYLYTWDGVTRDDNGTPTLMKGLRGYTDPQLRQRMADGHQSVLRGLLNYHHGFGNDHNLSLLLGSERTEGMDMNFNAFRRYFVSNAIDEMFAGGDLLKDNGGSASQMARLSYFGRANYSYKSKYLLEVLFRYDGSFVFPEDHRFGFFPGISLGYRITQEKFWGNSLPFINDLKIRGSWGQTGNDRIPPYQFAPTYGLGATYVFNGNVPVKSTYLLRTPNPNITWEVANQSNIGFDGIFFDNKLNVTFEYFHNVRSNILWWKNATVPASTGLSLPQENFAKVANNGFEVQAGFRGKIGELSYLVSANVAYAKNKILFWDEPEGIPDYQRTTGHPMNAALYYHAIGIFRDQRAIDDYPHWDGAMPGDIIFEDTNGDGVINGLDMVRDYKTDIPTLTGGAAINLGFKNFDLAILLQGAAGAHRAYTEFSGEPGNFRMENYIGRWTPENPDAKKPRTWNRTTQYWMTDGYPNNTYWVRKSDYLRFKNVELGYTFPKKLIGGSGIQSIRVYVNTLNILTFSPLVDFDPESPNGSNTSTDRNIWVNSEVYPPNKTINVGLSVTF